MRQTGEENALNETLDVTYDLAALKQQLAACRREANGQEWYTEVHE
jgi:hypothetical protein